jgi:FkbM family methyltransferase
MNKFSIRVLKKLNVLKYLNTIGSVSLNDTKFKIPVTEEVGFSNLFMSEPWMIDLLKIVLPIGNKSFVDVGINVGQTLLKLKSVSPEINYVGFEPNPVCSNYTVKLIKKNNIINTTVVPCGISDKTEMGVLNFYTQTTDDTSASMIADFRPDNKTFKKEFIPLFDIKTLQQKIDLDSISVLKIDVEGAELEVINSFKELISSKNPIILIEILPAYTKSNSQRVNRQNEIQNVLKELEYSIFRVIKQNEILIDITEILEIGIHEDLNCSEYVMVPKTKKEAFTTSCDQKLQRV